MKSIKLFFLICCLCFACASVKQSAVISVSPNDFATKLANITSGSTIQLKPEKYVLNAPLLIDGKENVTIDGNGATLVMNSLSENVVHLSNSKNIVLKNFKATHIEPSGPTGCTGNVIYMDNSDSVLVEKCDLNGSGIVGIAAYNIGALRVINNRIHENSEYGIIYMGPSIQMSDNTFEDNTKGHLFYSYAAKDASSSWPPKELINQDMNKNGLVMSNNTFE